MASGLATNGIKERRHQGVQSHFRASRAVRVGRAAEHRQGISTDPHITVEEEEEEEQDFTCFASQDWLITCA